MICKLFTLTCLVPKTKKIDHSRNFELIQENAAVREITITLNDIKWNLIECNLHALKKCSHQFAHVSAILFVIDLTRFQQGRPQELVHDAMVENLGLFDFVFNNPYFKETSVLLLFNKADASSTRFISPSPQHPSCNPANGDGVDRILSYDPASGSNVDPIPVYDPTDRNGIDQVVIYFIDRFIQRLHSPSLLYSHIIGGNSDSNISETFRFIRSAVNDIIIQQSWSMITKKDRNV